MKGVWGMKAYTSYFANIRNLDMGKCTAICQWKPAWYTGDWYRKVAPTKELVLDWKANHNEERYIRIYKEQVLDKLDPQEVLKRLDGRILLCYERPADFCHRHLLAQWLREHGMECVEIGRYKKEGNRKPAGPATELSLF